MLCKALEAGSGLYALDFGAYGALRPNRRPGWFLKTIR